MGNTKSHRNIVGNIVKYLGVNALVFNNFCQKLSLKGLDATGFGTSGKLIEVFFAVYCY